METKKHYTPDGPDLSVYLNKLNMPEIGVTVKNGVVTLTGKVDSAEKKSYARQVVAGVLGVKAIINTIEVDSGLQFSQKDQEITEAIFSAIQLSTAFKTAQHQNEEGQLQYWEIFT